MVLKKTSFKIRFYCPKCHWSEKTHSLSLSPDFCMGCGTAIGICDIKQPLIGVWVQKPWSSDAWFNILSRFSKKWVTCGQFARVKLQYKEGCSLDTVIKDVRERKE